MDFFKFADDLSNKRKNNLKPNEADWFTHIYEILNGLQKFADDKSNELKKQS